MATNSSNSPIGRAGSHSNGTRDHVAVIGSGVAGLTAAYVLQNRFDVTLYESADRLGGHAHTHDVLTPDTGVIPVDTGFIVFNERTYPLLTRLFEELSVRSRPTEMSMSVHCEGCGLEYAGALGSRGVFAQSRSLVNPRFLRMLLEVKKFQRLALQATVLGDDRSTLRAFLISGGFSAYFVRHYVVPVVSCVWSAGSGAALDYPARYLFAFLGNHGMLSITGTPAWRTVVGGSRTYVDRIAKNLTAVATTTPVRAVHRHSGGVGVRDDADQVTPFDRVVIATHADAALRLLSNPSDEERSTLGAFTYSKNDTWLHSDRRLLPRASRARASWNYLLPACEADTDRVLVSYDLNRLQALPTRTPHVVTLNATNRIAPDQVLARMTYEHPIYTTASVQAQERLSSLNDGITAFAGAYHGWGFHEDGCRSGVAAAASMGVRW